VEAKVSQRVRKIRARLSGRAVNNDLLTEGKRNCALYFKAEAIMTSMSSSVLHRHEMTCNNQYVISQGQRYKLVRLDYSNSTSMMIPRDGYSCSQHRSTCATGAGESIRRKDEENIANLYRSMASGM
jgi:hypothetical protein